MNTLVGTGAIASTTEDIGPLADGARRHKHLAADCVSRALGSAYQAHRDPVVVILHYIAQQSRWRVHVVDDDIDMAIIKEIPERCTASSEQIAEPAAGGG